MKIEIQHGTFVQHDDGIDIWHEPASDDVTAKDIEPGDGVRVSLVVGWFGRLAGDGYFSSGDWCGPYSSECAAREAMSVWAAEL